MSRIFYGDNEKDRQELMALISVVPDLEIEMAWTEEYLQKNKNCTHRWIERGSNLNNAGVQLELVDVIRYRIKE